MTRLRFTPQGSVPVGDDVSDDGTLSPDTSGNPADLAIWEAQCRADAQFPEILGNHDTNYRAKGWYSKKSEMFLQVFTMLEGKNPAEIIGRVSPKDEDVLCEVTYDPQSIPASWGNGALPGFITENGEISFEKAWADYFEDAAHAIKKYGTNDDRTVRRHLYREFLYSVFADSNPLPEGIRNVISPYVTPKVNRKSVQISNYPVWVQNMLPRLRKENLLEFALKVSDFGKLGALYDHPNFLAYFPSGEYMVVVMTVDETFYPKRRAIPYVIKHMELARFFHTGETDCREPVPSPWRFVDPDKEGESWGTDRTDQLPIIKKDDFAGNIYPDYYPNEYKSLVADPTVSSQSARVRAALSGDIANGAFHRELFEHAHEVGAISKETVEELNTIAEEYTKADEDREDKLILSLLNLVSKEQQSADKKAERLKCLSDLRERTWALGFAERCGDAEKWTGRLPEVPANF